MIRKAAIRIKGDSSLSDMDANSWRRILASNNSVTSSIDLRQAFAYVVQKLCNDLAEIHTTEVYLSCRLILLEKNPGLRPIVVVKFYEELPVKLLFQF